MLLTRLTWLTRFSFKDFQMIDLRMTGTLTTLSKKILRKKVWELTYISSILATLHITSSATTQSPTKSSLMKTCQWMSAIQWRCTCVIKSICKRNKWWTTASKCSSKQRFNWRATQSVPSQAVLKTSSAISTHTTTLQYLNVNLKHHHSWLWLTIRWMSTWWLTGSTLETGAWSTSITIWRVIRTSQSSRPSRTLILTWTKSWSSQRSCSNWADRMRAWINSMPLLKSMKVSCKLRSRWATRKWSCVITMPISRSKRPPSKLLRTPRRKPARKKAPKKRRRVSRLRSQKLRRPQLKSPHKFSKPKLDLKV